MQNLKYGLYALVGIYVLYNIFFSSSSDSTTATETVEVPTEGLITTVQEVDTNLFKISDEQPAPTVEDSRIIANYMSGTSDTFTLDEAKLVDASNQNGGSSYRGSGIIRAASYGFFGYMLGRSMSSRPPANAYTDPKTHSRVSNNAGARVASSARTVTRPAKGKSGYGNSSRSTRSYGG